MQALGDSGKDLIISGQEGRTLRPRNDCNDTVEVTRRKLTNTDFGRYKDNVK
jgi:hypothetical protein